MLKGYRKNLRHRSNLQELTVISRKKVINVRALSLGKTEDITCKQSLLELGTNAKLYLVHKTVYSEYPLSTQLILSTETTKIKFLSKRSI